MAEPHFRLATLLRLREATRDECRLSMAEACRADDELAGQLSQVNAEQRRLQDECRKAAEPGTLNINRLVEAHRYGLTLRVREDELRQQRKTLAIEIERRRQSLVKADQEVQILEKLRDRRHDRQRLEDERRQAKQLDETALQTVATSLRAEASW